MGSSIADQAAESSRPADSGRPNPLSRVVIVPRSDLGVDGSHGSGGEFAESSEPPFLGEQHETVLSKQPPGSSSRVSFDPIVAGGAVNSAELGAVLLGRVLGHFRLDEFVGGGGMGVVFRATDTRLGRTVAVKILSRDRTDEDTLRRFQNEAQSAARLDHENIARVYYVGEDQGFHYIVFEFIEGTNVRDLVQQKGPLPLEEAISYVLQVAEALEHASLRNVIHRDIKPSNILVTVERRAKLVDMGLARLHQMESEADDLTASGVTLGTFDYISPEQARDPRTADVRSDLYSLGCTFYFMLTGRPPFPEGTVLQKLLSHSTEDPTDPRMFRPDLDDQVVQILQRLLAKQPARRYQRPSELIGQLLVAAERLNMQAIAGSGSVQVAPRSAALVLFEKMSPWALPIVLFVIIAALLNGIWSSGESFDFEAAPIRLQPAAGSAAISERAAAPAEEAAARSDTAPGTSDGAMTDAEEDTVTEPPLPAKPLATPGESGDVAEVPATTPPNATSDGSSSADRPGDEPADAASGPEPLGVPTTENAASGPVSTPTDGAGRGPAIASSSASAVPLDTPAPVSSSPGKPAALAGRFPRIVVADRSDGWSPDVLAVPTLADACRDAQQLGATRIELHFNGPREESPLEITSGDLTICSGSGYQPLIVFRPRDESGGTAMVRAGGGRLVWQNIQVLLDLTEAPNSRWSLFRLRSFVGLELDGCVLTIRNVDPQGVALHPRVEFFAVEPRTATGTEGETAAGPIPYHLSLNGTIVRGQGAVVRASQATAFRLFVQNGLIVTTARLVDVEGSPTRANLKDGRVDVQLRHVTAALGEGVIRMGCDEQMPHQLELHTDFGDSILYVIDSAAPLFERGGISQIASVGSRLDLRGRDNFYPGSTRLLRLGPEIGTGETQEFDFDAREQLPFLEEKSPNFILMWKGLPEPGVTEDRQTLLHYELDDSDFNPAVRLDGDPPAGAILGDLPLPLPLPGELAPQSAAPSSG